MKLILIPLIAITTLTLLGCNDNGGSALSNGVREEIFNDSSVTSFQQISGVALNNSSLMDKILGTAYAVSGNVRCVEGTAISFQLDALGNTVQVDTSCNSKIDLSIRRGLLESMAGKRLLMSYAGGADARSVGRAITFNSIGSFWGVYDDIAAGAANTGHNEDKCKDKFTFNQSLGTVTIEHDVTNSLLAGADTTQDCLNTEFAGATLLDYKKVLNYRFKNGTLEMDPDGLDFTVNNDYIRFCIDNDSNGVCDV